MADFTAADVKALRDLTGAGMMDCKRALTEADGDQARAIEMLRIRGAAKAEKRGAERDAVNGLVAAAGGSMIELACETDFVAKNDQFQSLAAGIVALAASSEAADVAELSSRTLPDGTVVAEAVANLNAVIGEKIELRRAVYFGGEVTTYLHRRNPDLPPQVGVLVAYSGDGADAEQVARGTAMQVAAMRPTYLSRADVPEEVVAKEREIAEATAREEGKPDKAIPRIVEGRLAGYFKDAVLLEQASVQDQHATVAELLDGAGVTVTGFARFEVGAA
jgi:elongation factor Ts